MAEEINKTYTSNSLYNDSTGVIAFAEQLKQELINWANYQHVTEELGQNRPDLQNELNNLFLSVYERFLTFLNDADASEEAINTWKEIENFLADYTDEKTLASIVAELNNKIESRLAVPLESTTGSSTTSTMTQKAITETIDASKTFTTGEKVDNMGIDSEPTAGSNNLVKSGGVFNNRYNFALCSTPSETIAPSNLLWEQKTITNYITSASNNRCITIIRLANVSHIKIVPSSDWYISVWFYKEFVPSSKLVSTDYGVSNVGSTQNTIDINVPNKARMMAIWCRKADQSAFTPSEAGTSLTSLEFTTDHEILQEVKNSVDELSNGFLIKRELITSSRVLTDLPDANNALPNTLYLITSSNNWPSNMPSELSADGEYRYLITIKNINNTNEVNLQQYILDSSLKVIYCRRFSLIWTAWQSMVKEDTSFHIFPTAIRRQNYTTLLPNANNAEDNTMYLVYTNQGTKPDNFPSEYQGDGSYYLLHTSSYAVDAAIVKMQTLDAVDGSEHYSRRYTGSQWTTWESTLHKVLYVGSGQTYTTIKSAFEVANKYGNCDIYVLAGNYDIISEYGGQSALEAAVTDGDYGLRIGYGNRIHFATNAYVTCIYEGSNNLVMERFAPFNASTTENPKKQGFTLIGLNIDCKNVRYCVHDECAGTSKYRNHKYIDCTMHLDNTTSQYVSTYKSCIGGGLGKDCRIDIHGGYYKSETADAIKGAISYHNAVGTGATANARSEINVDGVYFDGDGTITFGYYGVSTLMTKCFVRNCSMKVAPNVHAESESYSTINMMLYAWNNEIRL